MPNSKLYYVGLLALLLLSGCIIDERETAWCEAHNMTQNKFTSTPGYCWNATCATYNAAGVGIGCSYVEVKIPEVTNVKN